MDSKAISSDTSVADQLAKHQDENHNHYRSYSRHPHKSMLSEVELSAEYKLKGRATYSDFGERRIPKLSCFCEHDGASLAASWSCRCIEEKEG